MTPGNLYLRLKQGWNPGKRMFCLWLSKESILRRIDQSDLKIDGTVVSFTTFSTRIKYIRYVLLSIIRGEVIPEFIVLYVSKETYEEILEMNDRIISTLANKKYLILKIVPDVRSYKKLVYALQDFPNKNIVTCDDDVIYPPYWLNTLYQKFKRHEQQGYIVAHRAHLVSINDNKINCYNSWEKEVSAKDVSSPTKTLFPTGTGGVLYPAETMPKITWNSNLFSACAPTNDDIWFWFCALTVNRRYVLTDIPYDKKNMPEIPNYSAPNLFEVNVNRNANDEQMKKCTAFFKSQQDFDIIEVLLEESQNYA